MKRSLFFLILIQFAVINALAGRDGFRKPASDSDRASYEAQLKFKALNAAKAVCKINTESRCNFYKPVVQIREIASDNFHIEHEAVVQYVPRADNPPIDTYTINVKDGKILRVDIKSLLNY